MSSIENLTLLIKDRENITKIIEEELKPHAERWIEFRNSQNPDTVIYFHQLSFSHMDSEKVYYRVQGPVDNLIIPRAFIEDRSQYFASMSYETRERLTRAIQNRINRASELRESFLGKIELLDQQIDDYSDSLI